MKVWLSVITFFVLLLTFGPGCGGGGTTTTDGTNTSTTSGGNFTRYGVEATKNGAIIDATNIIQGETVQFVVAGYTSTGARQVITSSNWSADPTGQSEGSMSGSGLFTATASGGGFTVSATADGGTRTGAARVKPPGQAIVTGRVTGGAGVFPQGAQVDFYDGTNTLVSTSIVQFNGTFRASVPATAVTFELNKNMIPSGFYKEYRYGIKWYLPQGLCRAPLPTLTNGQTTALQDIVVLSTLGAPPPPSSQCS